MQNFSFPDIRKTAATALLTLGVTLPGAAPAEVEWFSFTMDNDLFAGNDNGYTNGLYVAWFDGPDGEEKAAPGFLARAMTWSLPDHDGTAFEVDIGTVGQVMVTPDDITLDPPLLPPDDLPYAGMLYYTDTFIQVHETYADSIGVTIGVVGENSFAEDAQELVHEIISADEPCCWDDQLDDEVVFQVSRGRVWKTWVSDAGNSDLLLFTDIALGTISSSVGAGVMVRYGKQLSRTFAQALLVGSRTMNPVATQSGWYVFAGARAAYVGNNIFLDGSKSYDDDFEEIEYQEDSISATLGLAYSWKAFSLTFAMNDLNINEDDDASNEYSEYGTLTAAWKVN